MSFEPKGMEAQQEPIETTEMVVEESTALVKSILVDPVLETRKLPQDLTAEDAEQLLMSGDLNKLSAEGRLVYYHKRCRDLGLDPLARPFLYLKVPHPEIPNYKRLVLYATKECGEQLRDIHKITIEQVSESTESGYHEVVVRGRKPFFGPDGKTIVGYREEFERGGVEIAGKSGQMLANMRMKAVTKAKRRVTLALCAAGLIDETEIDAIPKAQKVPEAEQMALLSGITPMQQQLLSDKFEK